MRFSEFTFALVALSVSAFPSLARAAITVSVDEPYTLSGTGVPTLYLAGQGHSGIVDNSNGTGTYTTWPTTTSGQLFYFRIRGIDAAKPLVKVHAKDESYFLPIQPSVQSASEGPLLTGTSGYEAARITAADALIAIDLGQLCVYGQSRGAIDGCTGPNIATAVGVNTGIELMFSAYAALGGSPDTTEATTLRVKLVMKPLTLACPTPGFFPSDHSILVDGTQFGVATPDDQTAQEPRYLIVVKSKTTVNQTNVAANDTPGRINWHAGETGIEGFENISPETKLPVYQIIYGAVDPAGLTDLTNAACLQNNVFASNITGLLKESNCFIATASYRDPHAPGVELLRRFRDRFLLNFPAGRAFVKLYGIYGPPAAEWLLQNPAYRVPVLGLLLPLQAIALAITEPFGYLLFVLFAFGITAGLRFVFRRKLHRSRSRVSPMILAAMIAAAASVSPRSMAAEASTSNQPYIDSLLTTIDGPTYERSNEKPEPYIEEQRRKLKTVESSEGYTDRIRRDVGEAESSVGYTDQLRAKDRVKSEGSAIEDLKNGRKLQANTGDGKVRGVIGFNVGTAMNQTFIDKTADETYDNVYGSGWVPDIRISYEFKPWLDGTAKILGLYTSVGTTFTRGNGKFAYVSPDFDFGANSRTKFRFVTIPLQVGPMIRFPLGRIFTPYVGAGPALVGFFETRSDGQDGNHGYSPGIWANFGVNIGLNFLSKKSSWDAFATSGIKRTSLNVGYHLLKTTGGLLETTTTGVIAGFTFEI